MFHLTALASIVSPLWNSAPCRSLKVQVLRSFEASHSLAMAGTMSMPASKSSSPPVVPASGWET